MIKTQDVDTLILNEYIKQSGYQIGHIAKTLGISRQAFDKKRKGDIAFRASEVFVLCTMLKIPDDVRPKIFCVGS